MSTRLSTLKLFLLRCSFSLAIGTNIVAIRPFRYVWVDKTLAKGGRGVQVECDFDWRAERRRLSQDLRQRGRVPRVQFCLLCTPAHSSIWTSTLILHRRRRPPGDDWAFRGTYHRVPHTAKSILVFCRKNTTLWLLLARSTHCRGPQTVDFSGRIFLEYSGRCAGRV